MDKAICIFRNWSDFKFGGIVLLSEGEEPADAIARNGLECKLYRDEKSASELAKQTTYFFLDPKVAVRLKEVEWPNWHSDREQNMVGQMMYNVCRLFETQEG